MPKVDQSLVCYIRDMYSGNIVRFNVEKPQGYTDTYGANFQQQDVRGRSSPFQSYVNSGPRQISFSVLLSLDYRRKLSEHTESVRNMFKPYTKELGLKVSPPRVHVKIGKALDIEAIPVSFSSEWSEGYKDGVYRLCTWSFSFTEVEETGSFNNGESLGNLESLTPAGIEDVMTYSSSSESTEELSVGSKVNIDKVYTGYNTSNEAINSQANSGSPTVNIEPGEYYIFNVKGNAINVTQTPGEAGLGWIIL